MNTINRIGNKTYLGHQIVHDPDATKIAKVRVKKFLMSIYLGNDLNRCFISSNKKLLSLIDSRI
jgi:hypothetical protein